MTGSGVPPVPGTGAVGVYQLVWVDREGNVEPLAFEPRDSFNLDLSPDGQRIVLQLRGDDGVSHIWIRNGVHWNLQGLLLHRQHHPVALHHDERFIARWKLASEIHFLQ